MKWTFHPQHVRRTIKVWRRIDTRAANVESSRLARAKNAWWSTIRRPPPAGPVWGVSTVKNEADIIEEAVRNLIEQGVSHVLVADHGSTDGTADILQRLAEELPLYVVFDPIPEHWHGEKMSHLARAATRNGASWIVPFDGDELWKGTGGRSLAEVLQGTTASISVASWWDFMPVTETEGEDAASAPYARRFAYREVTCRPQVKVAFRANWPARIWIGNHHVTPLRRPTTAPGIRVAHFQFRSPEQVIRKANDGTQASRLAGVSPDSVPQWFEMEGRSVDDAAAKLANLVSTREMVHDPASEW